MTFLELEIELNRLADEYPKIAKTLHTAANMACAGRQISVELSEQKQSYLWLRMYCDRLKKENLGEKQRIEKRKSIRKARKKAGPLQPRPVVARQSR